MLWRGSVSRDLADPCPAGQAPSAATADSPRRIDFSAAFSYDRNMQKALSPARTKKRDIQVPVFIEKDEDGFYVVECPLFEGCYSQGKTVDEALRNIREVIDLIAEEKKNWEILASYHPRELSLHTITL